MSTWPGKFGMFPSSPAGESFGNQQELLRHSVRRETTSVGRSQNCAAGNLVKQGLAKEPSGVPNFGVVLNLKVQYVRTYPVLQVCYNYKKPVNCDFAYEILYLENYVLGLNAEMKAFSESPNSSKISLKGWMRMNQTMSILCQYYCHPTKLHNLPSTARHVFLCVYDTIHVWFFTVPM